MFTTSLIGGPMTRSLKKFCVFGMLAIAASAILKPVPAVAHHGRALIYDSKTETTVKATVTEFVWSNPHVQIGIEGVDANGARRQWLIEASSTGILADRGWSRKTLKVGDTMTISFHPGLKGS